NVLTTVREFRLLEYLASHRGRVLTRDQLLDAVWKETPFVTPRSIDVYIRRLRKKIERDPRHPEYLKTLRGIGYRFEVIADTTERFQILRVAGIAFNLFAQAADVDIDGARGDEGSLLPDGIEELIAGEDAAAMRGQILEQAKLADGGQDI